jgi:hypothetical protein
MKFNVPFIPDEKFIGFLNAHSESLDSCHFSLYSDLMLDARHRHQVVQTSDLIAALAGLKNVKKYLLMNSRIQAPQKYFDERHLRVTVRTLTRMLEAGVLDGIVFTDAQYLQALSTAGGKELSQLEAVPSINSMLDSFDKILAIMGFIAITHFKAPETLLLDRSLNRKMGALSEVSAKCRQKYPSVKLELLANEGCLFQCPFKPAHDCHISLSNIGMAFDTFRFNHDLGCIRYLRDYPFQILKSPFIRPEDIKPYEQYVDIVKICGRDLGVEFLMKTVSAYLLGAYSGNLLELLDALNWMSEKAIIPNHELPDDFQHQLSSCSKDCASCLYCENLLDLCAGEKPLIIPDRPIARNGA